MKTSADNKLITCVIPRGLGSELVESLHAEKGVDGVTVAHGRGISRRGGYFAQEVDILTVVVEAAQADDIFAYLYDRIDIDGSRRRFMYQQPIGLTTEFTLPQGVAEEEL